MTTDTLHQDGECLDNWISWERFPRFPDSVTTAEVVTDDLEALEDAYRATWSLFVAIEAGDNDVIEAIQQEYDQDTLLRGWHVVAARLLMALREHGERLGCGCGCEQWLEAERLNIAEDS